MRAQEDRAADLQTSLEALVVTEAETCPATSSEASPETRPEASPETRSKASPETRPDASPETRSEASILPAPQDTHETNPKEAQDTLQAAPGDNLQQPGHPLIQVDECVENLRCEGNCEHIGCRIKKVKNAILKLTMREDLKVIVKKNTESHASYVRILSRHSVR